MVLKRDFLMNAKLSVFKKTLDEANPSYNSLSSLRTYLRKQEESDLVNKKIRNVQNRMKNQLAEGIKGKKRIPGTGTKVVTTKEYKDTPENRKAGRVGQTYEQVTYKDAEYTDYVQKNMRRLKLKRKRQVDEEGNPIEPKKKRANFWIESMKEAKKELNAPSMILPKKEIKEGESDPSKILAHEVYLRAVQINNKKKAIAKIQKEAAAKAEAEAQEVNEQEA